MCEMGGAVGCVKWEGQWGGVRVRWNSVGWGWTDRSECQFVSRACY